MDSENESGTNPTPPKPGVHRFGDDHMAKVAAYHTTSPEYPPSHRNVYHDHDDCHDGKAIKAKDRVSGTAGRPRCKVCIDLG